MTSTIENASTEEPINPKSKLWKKIKVDDWKNSVLNEDSVFYELYSDTRRRIIEACQSHAYDVIVEVGCGTGEVIGGLEDAGVQRIGIDINQTFIEHCKATYAVQKNLAFHVVDATKLDAWWKESGYANRYKAPLMVCPNNTLTVMAEGIREELLRKMRMVAGTEGRCCITFWNGRLFAHGVMGYYKKNSNLCGDVSLKTDVDWDNRAVGTKTGYKSAWLTPEDIVRWMNSLLIQVDLAPAQMKETLEIDHVAEYGIGVYLWLSGTSNDEDAILSARDYYDSKDAQAYYSTVWGHGEDTHIGRYDLLEADNSSKDLSLPEKIHQAQMLQQDHLLKTVSKHYDGVQIRCLDMGCGYGGLLRSMARRDLLWSGTGVDISGRMIDRSRQLTEKEDQEEVQDRLTFLRENYMNTSVQSEGMDLVLSVDAFDHVGSGQHKAILHEAWRVLRPGGRLIFTDIMLRPDAPADHVLELQKRMNMKAFGSLQEYRDLAAECGFGEFAFEDSSENIATHYGTVHDVLDTLWKEEKIAISSSFKEAQTAGLRKWRELAPSCLQWGIVSMRKVGIPSKKRRQTKSSESSNKQQKC